MTKYYNNPHDRIEAALQPAHEKFHEYWYEVWILLLRRYKSDRMQSFDADEFRNAVQDTLEADTSKRLDYL